ncbi:Hypothetical predicted protein [Mytilus galloprovincialis]|uniref:Uncharacterized protein n=1 Tax=Mytilus galloprovincialis TaxID=29158 RepID=A0A8B6CWV6_MYTGA|nr:Hypothetical predicted protein [Mytilus galloprovincialis]
MEFAQKESELRKQNALLEEEQKLVNAKANASLERKKVETEANIKLLQHQKEAEVAEAEYRVLESEIDTESDESDLTPEKLKLNGKIDPAERTAKFVSQQSQLKDTSNIEEVKQGPVKPQINMNVRTLNPTSNRSILRKNKPIIPENQPSQTFASDLTRLFVEERFASFKTYRI